MELETGAFENMMKAGVAPSGPSATRLGAKCNGNAFKGAVSAMGLVASLDSRLKACFQVMFAAIKAADQAIVEKKLGFTFCTWTESEPAGGEGCIQEPTPISGNQYNDKMSGQDII